MQSKRRGFSTALPGLTLMIATGVEVLLKSAKYLPRRANRGKRLPPKVQSAHELSLKQAPLVQAPLKSLQATFAATIYPTNLSKFHTPQPAQSTTTMVHKILFWSGFGSSPSPSFTLFNKIPNISAGVAVRLWQLGIEMRPFFNKESLWAYPVFAAAGGSFGYWLTGVQSRQNAILTERRNNLLAKRRRRAEREGTSVDAKIAEGGVHEKPVQIGGSGGADVM